MSFSEGDEDELPAADSKRYQASVARANYPAQDRAGIRYAVRELARSMSCLARGSWGALVTLGKCLEHVACTATCASAKSYRRS